eukprot:scaffold398_cov198-Alexandrium_tamarense.AAC.9
MPSNRQRQPDVGSERCERYEVCRAGRDNVATSNWISVEVVWPIRREIRERPPLPRPHVSVRDVSSICPHECLCGKEPKIGA